LSAVWQFMAALINAHSDPGFDNSSIHFTRLEITARGSIPANLETSLRKSFQFSPGFSRERGGFWNPIRGSGFLLSASRGMAFQAKPRANFYSPLFGVSVARVFVAEREKGSCHLWIAPRPQRLWCFHLPENGSIRHDDYPP
jgi:hypothetical protein